VRCLPVSLRNPLSVLHSAHIYLSIFSLKCLDFVTVAVIESILAGDLHLLLSYYYGYLWYFLAGDLLLMFPVAKEEKLIYNIDSYVMNFRIAFYFKENMSN
jgi:hypothetical protein